MIINQTSLAFVNKTVRGLFLTSLEAAVSMVPQVTMATTTTTGEAMWAWLGNLPSMKPFKGELEKQVLATSDWTVKTSEYALAYEIKKLDLTRDQFGIYTPIFSAAGERAGQHKDKLLADLFAAGFSAKDYTGKNFFDTDKKFVKGVGTTFTNKLTKKLTLAHYRTAKKMIRSFKDPAGYPVVGAPQFTLVVGPELEGAASDILKTDKLANGASNTEFNTAKLEVWNYLDGGNWFLLVNNSSLKPFVLVNEIELDLYSQTDMKSDAAFNRHTYAYQAYAVHAVNYGLPQLIVGSTGADD